MCVCVVMYVCLPFCVETERETEIIWRDGLLGLSKNTLLVETVLVSLVERLHAVTNTEGGWATGASGEDTAASGGISQAAGQVALSGHRGVALELRSSLLALRRIGRRDGVSLGALGVGARRARLVQVVLDVDVCDWSEARLEVIEICGVASEQSVGGSETQIVGEGTCAEEFEAFVDHTTVVDGVGRSNSNEESKNGKEDDSTHL